ncbi:hypothetical protein FRC12_017847 [Ceratobasidium sp. 428]|nr:hypothetical protein FRC12_017847 [Ceratobasidium sp. 428]
MLECRLAENKPQLDDPGQHALTNANQNRNGQDTGHLNTTARDSGASLDTDEVSSGPNTSLEMVSILSTRHYFDD